jgi:hypothetical protein
MQTNNQQEESMKTSSVALAVAVFALVACTSADKKKVVGEPDAGTFKAPNKTELTEVKPALLKNIKASILAQMKQPTTKPTTRGVATLEESVSVAKYRKDRVGDSYKYYAEATYKKIVLFYTPKPDAGRVTIRSFVLTKLNVFACSAETVEAGLQLRCTNSPTQRSVDMRNVEEAEVPGILKKYNIQDTHPM